MRVISTRVVETRHWPEIIRFDKHFYTYTLD